MKLCETGHKEKRERWTHEEEWGGETHINLTMTNVGSFVTEHTEESFKLGLRLGLHLRLGLGQVGWHFIRQKCITECELIRVAIRVAQRQWVTVESAGLYVLRVGVATAH